MLKKKKYNIKMTIISYLHSINSIINMVINYNTANYYFYKHSVDNIKQT